MTEDIDEFETYLNHLAQGSRIKTRAPRRHQGLPFPLGNAAVTKEPEPTTAQIDRVHASANRQSLHRFVVKVESSDQAIIQRVQRLLGRQ